MLVFDLDDYFGEITELSTSAPQITATEPTTRNSGEADTATGGDGNPEDAPVGAIQPSSESVSAQAPIWWDDRLSFEDVSAPSAVPAQIVANEQILEKFGTPPTRQTASRDRLMQRLSRQGWRQKHWIPWLRKYIPVRKLGAEVSLK